MSLKAFLRLESLDGRIVPDATQLPLTTEPPTNEPVLVSPPSDPQTPPPVDPGDPIPPGNEGETDGPQVADPPKPTPKPEPLPTPPPLGTPQTQPTKPDEVPQLSLPGPESKIIVPDSILAKIKELREQIASLQKDNVDQQGKLVIATARREVQEASVEQLKSDLKHNEEQLQRAKDNTDYNAAKQIEGRIEYIKAALGREQTKLDKYNGDEKAIQDKIAANLNEITKLKAQIADLILPYLDK